MSALAARQGLHQARPCACLARRAYAVASSTHRSAQPVALLREPHSSLTGRTCQWGRRRHRRRTVLTYAWGEEITWTPVKVTRSHKAAEGLQTVVLDIGQLALGYQKGGQFLQLKVAGGKPGFYAIASGPDPNNKGVVELLVKCSGETAEALCNAAEGSEVEASNVMGKGFPVDKCPPGQFPTLLIFATGSGISPIRSLIESQALQIDQRPDVRLYYGTLDAEHTAFADLVPAWEAQGVRVKHVYSQGKEQYVQDAFAKDGVEDGSKACAVLVGQKEMAAAVTELLEQRGVSKDCILTNF